MNPSVQPSPSVTRQRGFSLIVTITLMLLLSVLAVGLLSLSSIALRSSSRTEAMATARANARLALSIAIGELQQEMGPDQRISAPHDAGDGSNGGRPHWTAVYDAWERTEGQREDPETREVTFRKFLVSGDGTATTSGPMVEILGAGTVGSSATEDQKVSVPLQDIRTDGTSGGIAWWISDEGTKAKVNAGPEPDLPAAFSQAGPLFDSQSPPHPDQKAVPELSDFDWEDGDRKRVLSTHQLELAAGLPSAGLGTSFHDTTVHSLGVLSNVRTGGLKNDLSNLLSRDTRGLIDMPVYLGDGRMNDFQISENGAVSNSRSLGRTTWDGGFDSSNQWGINLEELHLFHELYKEVEWSGGSPSLTMESTRERIVRDPFYLYHKPTFEGVQFIFSLSAISDPARSGKYKLQMHLDAMVAIANPNDVPLVFPPGLVFPFQLYNLPYELTLKITKSTGTIQKTSRPPTLQVFKGHVGGGTAGVPARGFRLEPGEAAVFGTSNASGFELNLDRGFAPDGGVALTTWNLQADNLDLGDRVDFEFKRMDSPGTYCNFWLGPRTNLGWQMGQSGISSANITSSFIDSYLPKSITPPQIRRVGDFRRPQPTLMLSFLRNVEKPSGVTPPDAFASRPWQLGEPAKIEKYFNANRFEIDRHALQSFATAEPMNYQFRTLAAGEGGRNIYVGGGRQPNLGGSFHHIHRRIPLSPPLSLGSFQNAIASGFCDHFSETSKRSAISANPLHVGGDPFPGDARALTGLVHGLPVISRAIGNSFAPPQLKANEVFRRGGSTTLALDANSSANIATDHSWMINTALWDSWFLSGMVNAPSSGWLDDPRSPQKQFEDLAKGTGRGRNPRLISHNTSDFDEVAKKLFSGGELQESAIYRLPAYLLVDGAFNVNSTSKNAWKALFASVREQELLTIGGSNETFNHPFGTLGYAANPATSGTEGDWSGLRDLDNSEIDSLAEAMVEEVKARGPFLSLADFVNRRPSADEEEHRAVGALQAAINSSGLNDDLASGQRESHEADFSSLGGAGIDNDPAPARSVGSPGYLSQADLLIPLGPQISVRSDTFVVRAYGEARDSSGKITARAWCEALLQRVPEYLDHEDEPWARDGWPRSSDELQATNATFGRRFVQKSFRWLHPSEV